MTPLKPCRARNTTSKVKKTQQAYLSFGLPPPIVKNAPDDDILVKLDPITQRVSQVP